MYASTVGFTAWPSSSDPRAGRWALPFLDPSRHGPASFPIPTMFDHCQPRRDVLQGSLRNEDLALTLTLALLFRTLAPMRGLGRIRQVANGIEKLGREEAGYWLGMAAHQRNPRRVLAALRLLLTSN